MLTGVSSATRVSHQRAISSAWRLVSEAANLQPVLPVQATRPERIALVLDGEAERLDALLRLLQLLGRNAGDQQILPDREAQIAVAELARDGGKPAHLRDRHPPDRHDDADPVAARPASAA